MQLKLVLAALLGLSVSANVTLNKDGAEFKLLWNTWKQLYSKTYAPAEEAKRFGIFAENYLKFASHNAKSTTYKKGLNQFSDLTGAEFKQQYASGYKGFKTAPVHQSSDIDYSTLELADSVDWRTKGAVTAIKDQGQCGSCWAFSSTGALEGLNFIKSGKLVSFSEQQLVDCEHTDHGCLGGLMDHAFKYTAKKGIEADSDYPYTSGTTQHAGTCKFDASKAVKVNSNHVDVTAKNPAALKTALATQPISVAIEADQDVFQGYTSGVITGADNCGAQLDHGVLVVGYTTVNTTEAFIVKNSWADTWGDAGYVYLATDGSPNGGAGVCGILSSPSYPTA